MTRRTVLRASAGTGLLLGATEVTAEADGVETMATGPETRSAAPVRSTSVGPADGPTDVLLIKDCDPWSVPGNEVALDNLDYGYRVLTSSDAVEQVPSEVDLGSFAAVVLPSTQSTEYYRRLNQVWSTVEGFVADGGTLVVHAGERGWPCSSGESLLRLPGGVTSNYNFELTGGNVPELQELTVTDADHPVVDGLSGADLSYWASDISSFGYLSGLPEDATAVVGLSIDPDAHPTYVEYPFGDGRVLVTMQAPEWPFGDPDVRDGTTALLENEIAYAVETEPTPGPDPQPTKGVVTGTLATTDGSTPPTSTVSLVDPVDQYAVIDSLFGDGAFPPAEARTTTSGDGGFVFEVVEPGRYLLTVEPGAPYEPTYTQIAVPADETTDVSVTVGADRHLAQLDSTVERLRDAAKSNVRASTSDVSTVYVDGVDFFDSEWDATDYLSKMLDLTNFALGLAGPETGISAAAEIQSFAAEQTVIPLAEHGHHFVLKRRWESVAGTRYQDELASYSQACREIDWVANLDSASSVPIARTRFSNTAVYQETTSAVDDQFDRYDTDVAYREPAEEFSLGAVKSVLETQARWLEGNGVAPGTMITPAGDSYVTRETNYHAGYYRGLRDEFRTARTAEVVSSGVSAAGKGLVLSGVYAPAGAVASVAGWAGSMALAMYQVHLKNKIGDAWVNSLTRWVSDLDDASTVTTDLIDWLAGELADPTVHAVEGRIDDVDLGGVDVFGTTYAVANGPSYPGWWGVVLPTPKWQRVATNAVSVTNTGATTADVRVVAVDTYGDGRTSGFSDAVSFAPDPEHSDGGAVRLRPGESTTIEHEYASDFRPFNPFNWHYMSTSLWMDGKYVDEREQPYYVVPNLDLIPGPLDAEGRAVTSAAAVSDAELLASPLRTDGYVMTDGRRSGVEAMTVQDWTEYVGAIESLLDTEVSPADTTASTSVSVDDATAGIVFLLGTTPEAELNLHVRDELGNHVGYDRSADESVVEIPDTDYSGHESSFEVVSIEDAGGTYDVTVEAVSFTTDSAMPVSLYAVRVPRRDAVMTVAPGTVGNLLRDGATASSTIEVGETGNQRGFDVVDVRVGEFATRNGDPLSNVAVTVSDTQFSVGPGRRTRVDLRYDAAGSLSLPSGPETRFEAPVRIETASTGAAEVTASVLLLDTDVADARLVDATLDVEGVRLAAVDRETLPSEQPSNGEVVAAFEITATGSGEAAVALPYGSLDSPRTFVPDGDGWASRASFVDDDLIVRFEAPTDSFTVAVAEVPVPDPFVGNLPPRDLDADGRYEDVVGDGRLDFNDAIALAFADFDAINDDPVARAAFDFDGSGTVDFEDAIELAFMV